MLNAASGRIMEGSGWDPKKMGDMQFNKTFEINRIEVDPQTNRPKLDESGNEIKSLIEINDAVILPGSTSEKPNPELWTNLVDVSFGEQTLREGYNIFELTVISEYKNYMGYECAANMGAFKVLVLPEECGEHTLVKIDGKPSDCLTLGEEDYWRCSECTRTYADESAQHRIYNAPAKLPLGEHVAGPEATCKDSQVCTKCGVVIVDKSTVAHTPGEAATCEREQTCNVCGVVLQQKTAHTYDGNPVCGESRECTVCHQTVKKEHVLSWHGNEAKCDECGQTVGKRYIIQAEDENKVTLSASRVIEETTVTSNRANSVSNSAEGGSLSGLENNQKTTPPHTWVNGSTITIALNVESAGVYKLGIRCQANQSSGNGNPQDMSSMFKYKVNDGDYNSITGMAASSTQASDWHRTYNWGIVYFGEAELNAGDNTVVLQYQGGRGCNIDYFIAETAAECAAPEAEIVYFNGQTAQFTKGASTKYGVLENVVIRLAVPESKRAETGIDYRDYTITDDMLGGA